MKHLPFPAPVWLAVAAFIVLASFLTGESLEPTETDAQD